MVTLKSSKIVGTYIKQRRQALDLSQRALGQMLTPPVTTQFISNLERGVTPLPLSHLSHLAKALQIQEAELTSLLEKEYAFKLSHRLGFENGSGTELALNHRSLQVSPEDYELMKKIYEAYKNSDAKIQEAFLVFCETQFGIK